ncbi:tail adaptor [Caudoviricetes sp.]|nr:tail adaptor [Caudoviricetes sp.]
MATSGSTTWNLTARDVASFALRKLRVIAAGETASAEDMAICIENLDAMLKGWQIRGPHLFRHTEGSLALTSATESYALTTPYRIISARFKQNDREIPMEEISRTEYFDLPYKDTTGIPTQYYFDPQRDGGRLYLWPVLATATTETVEYTYQRRFESVVALNNNIDVPQEWLETVGYALAARIADDFGKDPGRIENVSRELIDIAMNDSRDPFYRFIPTRR